MRESNSLNGKKDQRHHSAAAEPYQRKEDEKGLPLLRLVPQCNNLRRLIKRQETAGGDDDDKERGKEDTLCLEGKLKWSKVCQQMKK